jgi:hypothetical protein
MMSSRRRWALLAARRAVAVLALGFSLGSLAESHPGAALHGDLAAATWVFSEARHGGDAPHAEAAGAPHRFECRACLHRLQTGGAALRAVPVARQALPAGELLRAAGGQPFGRDRLPRSSRAPPLFS